MKNSLIIAFVFFVQTLFAQTKEDIARWESTSKRVDIVRDKWGIPHIFGKTDADCVFGLLYAQCEDDFQRVEMNYITMLGRTSEVKGEKYIYEDLLVKMVIDSAASVKDYNDSPEWMKKLLNAFADGVNYYLYTHPNIKPALLKQFKPWYPLTYTDGSISAIQTSNLTAKDIQNFYEGKSSDLTHIKQKDHEQLIGSNGFAISPSRSISGNAMLYINPHVTFYFRPEVHMMSEEGLNTYGAVTWGQFFVYQGFNEHCGWMHTSSEADVADLYEETIVKKENGYYYKHDNILKPVKVQPVEVAYKSGTGMDKMKFDVFSTHHGPVMAKEEEKWISMHSNNRSLNGLIQSWSRTKSKTFADFKATMDLRENVSNNTVYADDQGNIAYWHGNFMPKRDIRFDWNDKVDGSTSATDWKGLHTVDETVHLYNPANGWLQNCNSTPFTAAGPGVISKKKYPDYMAPDRENFRGINAVRLLNNSGKLDINGLIRVGYDTYLSAFDILLPPLFASTKTQIADNIKSDIMKAIQILSNWDKKSSVNSIATTIAILWAERVLPFLMRDKKGDIDLTLELSRLLKEMPDNEKINFLNDVLKKLKSDFGTWEVKWGDLNRFQRIENKLSPYFDDAQPSIPTPFASSMWGSLPSFNSRTLDNSKKRYGYGGNSFVCAVEFGKKIKARSLLAGGQSGDPSSKHFKDQAEMYCTGQFKDVLFYREDIMKNMEEQYNPGKRK
ncbi:MAG: penicillin acylase family protein [Bacteroidota bacterium]|jgi:acyl-homoserine-lactone acylase